MFSSLSDRERLAKLETIRQAMRDLLYITKPTKACSEHGDIWEHAALCSVDEQAEVLLKDLEQVELDFWNKYEESKEQSRN